MDTKSKVLFVIIAFFVTLSILATFYKTVALEDFVVVYEEEEVSEDSEVLDSPESEEDILIEDLEGEESFE